MRAFDVLSNPSSDLTTIKLQQSFVESDWDELVRYYKDHVGDGCLHWELNFTDVPFITSNSIGMIIALNTSIMANGGQLTVVLAENSNAATQIRFARIDQIVKMTFLPPAP